MKKEEKSLNCEDSGETARQSWREPSLLQSCKDAVHLITEMSEPSRNLDKGRRLAAIYKLYQVINKVEGKQ